MTALCDLGYLYKTDKCPQIKHHFTEFYDEMFKDRRESVKKVVEIGIGNMHPYYVKGASLYMWRDYFPNAMIYGADIEPGLMFEEERIQTVLCDQTKIKDLEHLLQITGGDIDLFIDDGLHTPESQIFTCLAVMQLISSNTIYVIEDVGHREIVERLRIFDTHILRRAKRKYNDDCLVVVRHGLYG